MDFAIQNKINRRVKQLQRDGVLFLSGTVAPAESDVETQDIESLEKALNYFADKGVETLHIQPKWMGSRCQVYLFRDIEKCYAVTRNGFRIKHVDLTEVFQKLMPLFDAISGTKQVSRLIIDGELLPWSALGGTLIEREFVGLSTCVSTEVNLLEQLGFQKERQELWASDDYHAYRNDSMLADRKTMAKRYSRFETYDNFEKIIGYDIGQERNDLALYEEQLALYNANSPLEFKGFDILHVLFEDGSTEVERFMMENIGVRYSILRIAEGEQMNMLETGLMVSPKDIEQVRTYFTLLVMNGYEGIMIKPLYPNETDAVNCMKVRNKEYLRIIYGYDYQRPEVLEQLVARKRVGKKRKLSHHEYKLGQQMLQLDPAADNYTEEFERIAKAILFEIEEEATIDLRL